jgi:hypothetical protein
LSRIQWIAVWAGLGGIEELEELTAAVAILDQGVNLAGQHVDSGQQAHRPMTLVFMPEAELSSTLLH